MTNKLVEMFKEEFPPIDGFERVSIYENYERIYLNLISSDFLNNKPFNDSKKIFELAKKTFDVPFTFENKGDYGEIISFEDHPFKKYKGDHSEQFKQFIYEKNYCGHFIKVDLPFRYPLITISTANRGAGVLLEKQRNNYFNFVIQTYNLFLENK